MEQLLAHLIGDYILQSHWMANMKTKAWAPAIIHVLLYGVPFLLLVDRWEQWAVIVLTHLLIDKYRLAAYWVDFWGTGKVGWLPSKLLPMFGYEPIIIGDSQGVRPALAHGFPARTDFILQDAPPWLGVWLMILVDNTLHMTINFSALKWL